MCKPATLVVVRSMLGFPRETHNTHQLAVPHHSFTDTCDFCNVAKLKQLILKELLKGSGVGENGPSYTFND